MSTPDECSTEGFSQTACGFVVEFADIVALKRMNPGGAGYSNPYELGHENYGSWEYCELRPYINETIYISLPLELKEVVIDTKVITGHGNQDSNNFTTTDKLYLLSGTEVFARSSDDTSGEFTRQLDYYTVENVTSTTNTNIPTKLYEGTSSKWWLRNPYKFNAGFTIVQYSGYYDYGYASTELYGVSPAFRIG